VTATEALQDPAEVALVRRAQAGDTDAFGELVERHRRVVFRAVLAAVGSPEDADDVTQEAFVTAFRKLRGFRGDAAFRTWLLTIAWRKALDRRKRVMRWMQRLVTPPAGHADDGGDPIERVASTALKPDEQLATMELQKRLRPLIAALPKKLRDALLLAGSGDYRYDEIGQMLKIPVGTVKWRVSEARRQLKVKMAAMGYTDVR
jgi:RNA polymerase sigma-70 factor (ECF subfamily)